MSGWESGNYRNLFAEIGKSEAEIDARIREAVRIFFYDEEERIYHEAGADMGYLTDTGNDDVRTEGMSYGMMLCVQLDSYSPNNTIKNQFQSANSPSFA